MHPKANSLFMSFASSSNTKDIIKLTYFVTVYTHISVRDFTALYNKSRNEMHVRPV